MHAVCTTVTTFDSHRPLMLLAGTKKCQQKSCQPFILVIQTLWQRDLVKRLAASGHLDCVCLDATFQVTMYRWGRHAIVGPDVFGEAVPLAYCITSSETWEPITKHQHK